MESRMQSHHHNLHHWKHMLDIYGGIDEQINHAHMRKADHLASNSSVDLASIMMRKSTLGPFLGRQEAILRGEAPISAEAS